MKGVIFMRYRPKTTRDLLAVEILKGKRDVYKQAAAELGLSLSMLVQTSVEEFIRNHAGEEFIPNREDEKLSAEERRLIVAFDSLPKDTRTIVLKLVEDFAAKLSSINSVD